MTRISRLAISSVVAMSAAATVLLAHSQAPQATQPVFRTSTDLVSVDVGVKHDGAPVTELKASDFVLLDNGVPQRVEIVDMETVPVDVTILVDTAEDIGPYMSSLNDQLRKIAGLVRPDDRLRVLGIDTYVSEILPLQRSGGRPPFDELKSSGLSSAHDALAASLIQADPNRPSLIIALTDSIDSVSTLSSDVVRDIARQSSATLHISWVTMAKPPKSPNWYSLAERMPGAVASRLFDNGDGMSQGSGVGTHRYWKPYNEAPTTRTTHDFKLLREAADLTGGKLHEPGIFTDVTATAVFKHAFEDFRRSYLLRYTPQGVPREGWHDIKVTLPAHHGYTVHARRGYAIENSSPVAAASPTPVSPSTAISANRPPSLSDITLAYERGDYAGAEAVIHSISDHAQLIRDFRVAGNPWPLAVHREAALVLDLAAAALFDSKDDAHQAARDLLAWYSKLVRQPIEPDTFEHEWVSAELQLLQGANQPALAKPFIAGATARYPDEPRFPLANAIVADQLTQAAPPDAGSAPVRDAIALYDAAMKNPATTFEGHVREAWLLHRVGRDADALLMLDGAGERAPDAAMGYLRELFRGRALASLGRQDDATTAGARAETLKPTGEPDTWTLYWQGDYRLYAGAMDKLRARLTGGSAQ